MENQSHTRFGNRENKRRRGMKQITTVFLILMAVSTASASGETVPYMVDGKPFEGYFISPSPKAPLILLIHDWDGLTDYEVKRGNMLADLGYSVFAADLFGAGVRPTELKDKRRLTSELYADRGKMRSLLQGALEAAKSKGADIQNAVAMGYCFGGTAVLELARSGTDLKGFVTFHGGLQTPEGQSHAKTKGNLLILHGTADTNVTMDHFATLATELEEKQIPHEMITYSGAPHAFSVFGSSRYREDADRKSWHRFTGFLTETLDR
ncbi:MAG: dienelactone hydrolase family protein [Desulfobacterium sp.]|nr:dienelactone hydrolase family protein [Desulfobacterium sp.]